MKHAYLLHTGYGKTKLMLDKIMSYPTRPRVLLISTKNIVETSWQGEIDKWYPGQLSYTYITGRIKPKDREELVNKPTDILALNTEMIDWYISHTTGIKRTRHTKNGLVTYYNTDELIDRFDMIIIDESSLFKSYKSNRFKALKSWCNKVQDVFILSATPTPKDIEDLWSQIYLLDGGQRLGKNITAFRENYGMPVPMYNGQTRWEYSQKAVDYVLSLVKDIVTSVPTPKQPLFPEPIIKRTLIKPDEETNKLLLQFKEDYIIKINNENIIARSKNQLMIKINQLASGFIYNDNVAHSVNNIKFEALKLMLSKITTPVLITYVYVVDKDKLLSLPGAVLLDNPQAFKDWNDNKIKIGVLSPFSVAHGLNLQSSDCQDIIWFSPIWDTEKWQQTNARVCRRGQTRQVTIRVLLLKNSFDEYMFDLVQTKFVTQYNNLRKLA